MNLPCRLRRSFLRWALRKGGGRGEYEHVRGVDHLVDVAGEADAVEVELHAGQVAGVASLPHEVVYLVLPAHVPVDARFLGQEYLGDGGGPAASADDSNLPSMFMCRPSGWFNCVVSGLRYPGGHLVAGGVGQAEFAFLVQSAQVLVQLVGVLPAQGFEGVEACLAHHGHPFGGDAE